MAESYDRNRRPRRRRDHGEYSKRNEDVSPTPSKPPVTILGLAKPSRTSNIDDGNVSNVHTTSASSASASPSAGTNINPSVTDKATEGISYNEGTTDGISHLSKKLLDLSTTDKPAVTLLSSADLSSGTGIGLKPSGDGGGDGENRGIMTVDSKHRSSAGLTDENTAPVQQKRSSVPSAVSMISGLIDQGAQTQMKLAPPVEKQVKIKLVDDSFQWCDSGLELMLDQTDFLIVGIVGLQGCGKSTLLSLLAGNTHQDAYRNYVFFPQTKEAREDCLFQTSGIDMFVTSERVILLDTQPLLSPSMMDCLLRYDRKLPPEYSSLQHFVEMQSMQLVTFLMSICHVVLVAQDWFVDTNFMRFIQDAEMLKPSTQTPSSSQQSSDGTSSKEETSDFYPTIVFIHNRASREDFTPETYSKMQLVLHNIFQSSKLKCRSGISMTNDNLSEALIESQPWNEHGEARDINLLVIPTMEFYKCEPEWLQTTLPDYRGYPSFNSILSLFRSQVLSAPRSPFTHNTLTEKNWFHFAARMWEAVKKSPLLAEYNRLLSSSF